MNKYNHKKIEKKWQVKWGESGIYEAEDFSKKPKYYCLIEFPYPSGAGLHVGHLRSHIAIDIIARQKRMSGYNVLYPIGWDAFGLPTENYAIKTKTHPKIVTENNIKNFTKQIKSYGPSFDWSREINTTDPEYYKWTQWIFLKLFNSFYDDKLDRARPIEGLKIPKGLSGKEKREYIDGRRMAHEAEMAINWCPSCKIGLANEEVVNGSCERCGAPVEKKMMKQWMLRITKYADRLIKDLNTVDYLDKIKTQQVNWIGKSSGTKIKFLIQNSSQTNADNTQKNAEFPRESASSRRYSATSTEVEVEVFTTRPDTLFGCTYMVLSPEHPMISEQRATISNYGEVEKYINEAKNKSDLERTDLAKEKTGVELKGIKAINPVNNEEIPIWIADYVLASYGTGAIMAVPAHDERDFEFAMRYNASLKNADKTRNNAEGSKLEIRQVIAQLFIGKGKNKIRKDKKNTEREIVDVIIKHWKEDKYYCLDWEKSKNDWKTFIIGGIKDGESLEDAALREAKEESGYQNMKVVRKVGGEIRSKFFAAHKNVNRNPVKRHCVLIELLDGKHKEPDYEHIKNHDGVWVKRKDVEKFLSLPELKVYWNIFQNGETAFIEDGVLINSGNFTGLTSKQAREKIIKWLEEKKLGKEAVNYKLNDWVFSRQRYWGEPIPIVKCENCGNISLEEKDLPLELPEVKNYEPTETGESPLAKIKKWTDVKCPRCGEPAKRETDTMPNWAGSSWYFLAYIMRGISNFQFPISKYKEGFKYWMPVDLYNGGMEHTTLHLLYSRFWHKFLFDLGYVNTPEPYKARRSHGTILAEDGQKMSKSRGNVISPDDIVEKYGADSLRIYEMFIGPYEEAIPWNTSSLVGVSRFLQKVYRLANGERIRSELSANADNKANKQLETLTHQTIKKVTEDIESFDFNTAISQLMILTNTMEKEKKIPITNYQLLITLLSPFAPHMAEELWHRTRTGADLTQTNTEKISANYKSIFLEKWPKYNPELAKEKEIELVIQINGKVRDKIKTPVDISEDDARKIALESKKVRKWIEGKEVKKIIFVKGRLVNIVV